MKKAQHKISKTHDPHVIAESMVVGMPAGLANPKYVEKRWGGELIYINDHYCMKRIFINEGACTSMHFHVFKHETLMVIEGQLELKYKDNDGEDHSILIPRHCAWVVPPGFQHQLCAYNGPVVIIEASTPDHPEDSVRVRM